jgi:hypothetical protein
MLFGSFEWIECDHLDLSFVAWRNYRHRLFDAVAALRDDGADKCQ